MSSAAVLKTIHIGTVLNAAKKSVNVGLVLATQTYDRILPANWHQEQKPLVMERIGDVVVKEAEGEEVAIVQLEYVRIVKSLYLENVTHLVKGFGMKGYVYTNVL